jgi:RimJ/RimL family protein N-acetyltransferase
MDFSINRAAAADVNQLLGLYISIYGRDYPLELGSNREKMLESISDQKHVIWPVIKDPESGSIVAAAIAELDFRYNIAKISGVVVHRSYRGNGAASRLISYLKDHIFANPQINSIYTTTRTVTIASQQMFLKNKFVPLGIFPNARKIKSYESLTLMGIFREGVFDSRLFVDSIPDFLFPLLDTVNQATDQQMCVDKVDCSAAIKRVGEEDIEGDSSAHFEFVDAPRFVGRRFKQMFEADPDKSFYPFHHPNLMITTEYREMEIYASFNKKDHYCVLIAANQPIANLDDQLKELLFSMKDLGIYYIEALVRMDNPETLCYLYDNLFIPSAIYPVMREVNGKMVDYVLMTKTMVPLDFSELSITAPFKPFVDQYVHQWLRRNIDTLTVQ